MVNWELTNQITRESEHSVIQCHTDSITHNKLFTRNKMSAEFYTKIAEFAQDQNDLEILNLSKNCELFQWFHTVF